ncbi:MAG: hypothetical protein Q8K33_04560 [Cypionkella sp.]|nr:hypothetical protein [Cypionkella sp.]MDP2048147.1 hypothetical protein [Cypionkella sp.]
MTVRDGARLSLALLTGEPPSRVVEEFEFIRMLQTKDVFPIDGLIARVDLHDDHILEDVLTKLFELHSDHERIQSGRTLIQGFSTPTYYGPYFSVSIDSSRRTGAIQLPIFSTEYLDLAGAAEIEELYSMRPRTLEGLERIKELETRSVSSDSGSSVAAGRGMRVLRTITQTEILIISQRLFDQGDE